jgi:hypothetical protein
VERKTGCPEGTSLRREYWSEELRKCFLEKLGLKSGGNFRTRFFLPKEKGLGWLSWSATL